MYRKIDGRKMQVIQSKFESVPPLLAFDYQLKKSGGVVVMGSFTFLNQDAVYKGKEDVDVCLSYTDKKTGQVHILVTWNKNTGILKDYSHFELKKEGLLVAINEMIESFRCIRENEYNKSLNRKSASKKKVTRRKKK